MIVIYSAKKSRTGRRPTFCLFSRILLTLRIIIRKINNAYIFAVGYTPNGIRCYCWSLREPSTTERCWCWFMHADRDSRRKYIGKKNLRSVIFFFFLLRKQKSSNPAIAVRERSTINESKFQSKYLFHHSCRTKGRRGFVGEYTYTTTRTCVRNRDREIIDVTTYRYRGRYVRTYAHDRGSGCNHKIPTPDRVRHQCATCGDRVESQRTSCPSVRPRAAADPPSSS